MVRGEVTAIDVPTWRGLVIRRLEVAGKSHVDPSQVVRVQPLPRVTIAVAVAVQLVKDAQYPFVRKDPIGAVRERVAPVLVAGHDSHRGHTPLSRGKAPYARAVVCRWVTVSKAFAAAVEGGSNIVLHVPLALITVQNSPQDDVPVREEPIKLFLRKASVPRHRHLRWWWWLLLGWGLLRSSGPSVAMGWHKERK